MLFSKQILSPALLAACSLSLLTSCVHKKYDTPITKNTAQPDKVLFDQAVRDIEKGHYEVARVTLNTLMNTYESSEYTAKAKLAIADSWFREGGSSGWAQAEAEYKDFILFYPQMPEAAEAQERVCAIHYKQMDKSDRDITQTLRAEDECRQLMVQFPNSKFAPEAAQRLRNIQESLAEHEYVVGYFYWKHEMNPAAANRLNALVDQYPLYSKADEALFEAGDSYQKMGPRYRQQAGEMFARIVRDYPLGDRAKDAKARLEDLELPVPQPDPKAVARMKYERENYEKPGLLARSTDFLRGAPDVSHAAKTGSPTMTDPKKTIPVSVPVPQTGSGNGSGSTGSGSTDVTATTTTSNLDSKTDARSSQQQAPLPTNRQKELEAAAKMRQKQLAQMEKKAAKQKKKQEQKQQQQPSDQQQQQSGSNTTASTSTPQAQQ